MKLKQGSMTDIWSGTDSLRPWGATVRCDPVKMTVEYRICTYKFYTEAVAVSFADQLCAYPIDEAGARREGLELASGK